MHLRPVPLLVPLCGEDLAAQFALRLAPVHLGVVQQGVLGPEGLAADGAREAALPHSSAWTEGGMIR